MIKHVLIYILIFSGLYLIGSNLHLKYIIYKDVSMPFSLEKVYAFHAFFSAIICVNFKLLSTVNKFLDQLGFIYLASLVLKIVTFSIIFYQPIFKEENLSQIARISLFIPTIIFLLTEAIFVAKILNKNR